MEAENSFISVDWGTSNLRIRFVSDSDFQIQGEFFYNHGLKKMNEIEAQIVYDIILNIEKDTKLLDKHTSKYIKEVIETHLMLYSS